MPDFELPPDFTPEEEEFFELAAGEETVEAPSTLKSRVYSRLMELAAEEGPLRPLAVCKAEGNQLCIFEELVRIAPVGEKAQSLNYCKVCHARVLGEKVEGAPIYWPGCPYVSFQNR